MATAKSPTRLDDEDESVQIAVRALGDMRSRALANPAAPVSLPPIDTGASTQPTPALSTASSSPSLASQYQLPDEPAQPDFVSRVSRISLVKSTLTAYESSKANSRVVKIGAEMMESSVKSISRPVMDRLPLNQLDEFASRQLDRFGGRYVASPTRMDQSPERRPSDVEINGRSRGRGSNRDGGWSSGMPTRDVSMSGRQRGRDSSVVSSEAGSSRSARGDDDDGEGLMDVQQQVASRSRWQTMILEAGGIGAAVSEESMRRLKYCLQWLQYATAHIDTQITILRDFIASLQPTDGSDPSTALVTPAHLRTLNDVKRNVVDTIRQVVDVVSKYAGGALPEPARASVRQFILHLPQRFATHQRPGLNGQGGLSDHSNPGTPALGSPVVERQAQLGDAPQQNQGRPTAGMATQAANRVLVLATESLDMLKGVTSVVMDSLDRAETWVERLRIVGIQRQQQEAQGQSPREADGPWDAPSPTIQTTHSLGSLSLNGSNNRNRSKMSLSEDSRDGTPLADPDERMVTTPDGAGTRKDSEGAAMELDS